MIEKTGEGPEEKIGCVIQISFLVSDPDAVTLFDFYRETIAEKKDRIG